MRRVTDGSGDDLAAVSTLDEPLRRRLYDYVRRQDRAVTRDEAAHALGVTRSTTFFHLDKLVEARLLVVEFARRSGRTGPGAGRPTKFYRRSDREIAVRIPERSYELIGRLLAGSIAAAERSGRSPRDELRGAAREYGSAVGHDAGDVMAGLETCGYEPRVEDDAIVLANCPFHSLARQHTAMVCEMNLDLVGGLLEGCCDDARCAELAPAEGRCCVRIRGLA